jgi:hypothetical protein
MKSLFGGRLTRGAYAGIAVPIIVVQLAMPFITRWAPLLFANVFHATLANFGTYFLAMTAVLGLLPLVLFVASVKRLRDIGWSGWLAFPVLLKFCLGYAAIFLALYLGFMILGEASLKWLSVGTYWYVFVLVLLLLFIPSRKLPVTAEPAAAF